MPEYKIKRGDRAEIGILPDKQETERPSTPDAARKRGAVFAEDEESPIYRRGKMTVELFDTGRKLARREPSASDPAAAMTVFGGFVPAAGVPSGSDDWPFFYLEPPLARLVGYGESLTAASFVSDFLSGDLLSAFMASEVNNILADSGSTARVTLPQSGRELPLAAPIPFNANRRFLRVTINSRAFTLGDPAGDNSFGLDFAAEWRKRKTADGEDAEPWRSFAADSGEAHEAGILRPPRAPVTRIAVESIPVEDGAGRPRDLFGMYETFDTDDAANFIVGLMSGGDGDTFDGRLRLAPDLPVRLFLVPRAHYFFFREDEPPGIYPNPHFYYYAARFPLTPFNPFDFPQPDAETRFAPYLAGYVERMTFGTASFNPYLSRGIHTSPDSEITGMHAFVLNDGTYTRLPASCRFYFVAFVQQGETLYAVQRIADRSGRDSDLHPYSNVFGGTVIF